MWHKLIGCSLSQSLEGDKPPWSGAGAMSCQAMNGWCITLAGCESDLEVGTKSDACKDEGMQQSLTFNIQALNAGGTRLGEMARHKWAECCEMSSDGWKVCYTHETGGSGATLPPPTVFFYNTQGVERQRTR